MANAVYPKWKENAIAGNYSLSAAVVKVLLVDTLSYTYNTAHEDVNDISAGAKVFESQALTGKTFTDGTFDAADKTLTAVTGNQSEALILFVSGTSSASSELICYIDSGTNLPVTPNGGDIIIQWNASGIFSL